MGFGSFGYVRGVYYLMQIWYVCIVSGENLLILSMMVIKVDGLKYSWDLRMHYMYKQLYGHIETESVYELK